MWTSLSHGLYILFALGSQPAWLILLSLYVSMEDGVRMGVLEQIQLVR